MARYRVEHDSMGDVKVPVDALWGAQTQRAVDNFPISGTPVNERVIRALAMVKAEAARVNAGLAEVPAVDRPVANAIGVRVPMVPMTPARVLAALSKSGRRMA